MATEKLKYLVTSDTSGFSSLKKVGIAAAAAISAAFVNAVKVTAKFEKQVSTLRAITGATANEIKALEQQARKLGATTAFTATQVAEAQTELAKLGLTTREILSSSGGVLDLAAALDTDLAGAAKLVGSTMRQFGLDASEAGRIVDVLAESTTKSALDFSKLQTSLAIVGPAGNAVGASLEEVVAILGTLSNSGLDASSSGTALRKAFIEMNADGITLAEGLDKVKNSTDPLGEAVELVGKRAAVAFLSLAKGTATTTELVKVLEEAEGRAKEIASIKLDNLAGDTTILKSAWESFSIELGQVFTPLLRWMVQTVTKFVGWMERVLINIKILFKNISSSFITLAADLLEGVKSFREFLGLDTSKLDDQISGLRDRVKELNDEVDILKGKKLEIGVTPKNNVKEDPVTQTRGKITGVKTIKSKGVQTINPDKPKGGLLGAQRPDVSGILQDLENMEAAADAVGDAFDSLGQNISRVLTDQMGLFGAFAGAFIESSLQIIGQKVQESIQIAALEKAQAAAKIAAGAAGAAADATSAAASIAANSAKATGAAVASGAETAAASGPAAAFLLPALIAGAVAVVASAFSGIGGKASAGSGGGGRSAPKASIKSVPVKSQQGSGNSMQTVIRGDQLRYLQQQQNNTYPGRN